MLIDKAVETAPQTQQTENGQTESAIKPVSETAPITVDFERLQEENKDIIAWLYCPDTEINYPVVQSKDNEYYLRRLLDGTWNIAGTLFMDYRNAADCSDLHTIIYGHNMKNNTMFGSLPKYSKQEYYEEHSVLYLLTPKQNYKVKLIAGIALSMLQPLQRERLMKNVCCGLSSRAIAKQEGVYYSSVDKSIAAAKKNFIKFYENL